jgi:release factor glutamine methyltransferase
VAQANAERLGIDVELVQSHLLDGISAHPPHWDAIVSNPPYVADADRARLAPEITRYEPPLALFAGPSGLELVTELIPQAAERTGWLALEIGAGQADQVEQMLRSAGFERIERHGDLAGVERVLTAANA